MQAFLPPPRSQARVDDVIIIGVGASGTAVLMQLIKKAIRNGEGNLTFRIIEKTKVVGPGLPYATSQHTQLRVNDSVAGMVLNSNKTSDFLDWIKENALNLQQRYPNLHKTIDEVIQGRDRFPPRILFGEYCQERLQQYIELAKKIGIHVYIEKNTEIVSATPVKDLWHLKSHTGTTYLSKNLVIATGHMPSEKYRHLDACPHYFSSPYVTHLNSINPLANVAILGSGLSAIDAVKLLNSQNHRGKIYLLSQSGQIPRVKGPPSAEGYTLKYLTAENLDKADLTLVKVLHLLLQEIQLAQNNPSLTLEQILYRAQRAGKTPLDTLKKEITLVSSGKTRGWQRALNETFFKPLPIIWRRLNAEDRNEFLNVYFPIYNKWLAGIPLINAKEILQILEEGRLEILKIAREEIEFINGEYIIPVAGQTLKTSVFINGTGTGHNIYDNPLLSQLAQARVVMTGKHGGIATSASCHLVAPSGQQYLNAFALGPVTFGAEDVAEYAVEMGAIKSEIIANEIFRPAPQSIAKL